MKTSQSQTPMLITSGERVVKEKGADGASHSCDGSKPRQCISKKSSLLPYPSTPVAAAKAPTASTVAQQEQEPVRPGEPSDALIQDAVPVLVGAPAAQDVPNLPDIEAEALLLPVKTPVAFAILLGSARSQQKGYQYTDEECQEALHEVSMSANNLSPIVDPGYAAVCLSSVSYGTSAKSDTVCTNSWQCSHRYHDFLDLTHSMFT